MGAGGGGSAVTSLLAQRRVFHGGASETQLIYLLLPRCVPCICARTGAGTLQHAASSQRRSRAGPQGGGLQLCLAGRRSKFSLFWELLGSVWSGVVSAACGAAAGATAELYISTDKVTDCLGGGRKNGFGCKVRGCCWFWRRRRRSWSCSEHAGGRSSLGVCEQFAGAWRSMSRDLPSETRAELVEPWGLPCPHLAASQSVLPAPSHVMVGSWHL